MNNILKYKKCIVAFIICTFSLLSFTPPKKANAEVVTLTTGTILACAALATACGVVITNQDMIEDVGKRIWEGIKDSHSTAFTVDGQKVKVNTSVNLFKDIVDICKNLPIKDAIYSKILTTTHKYDLVNNVGFDYSTYGSLTFKYAYGNTNVTFRSGGGVWVTPFYFLSKEVGSIHTITYNYSHPDFYIYYDGEQIAKTNSLNGFTYQYGAFEFSDKIIPLSSEVINDITIPYTEENSKNVSADIPKDYFPSYGGSISVPMDKPISDYTPSISAPITKPQDFVGVGEGDIIIESDGAIDGDVEIPGENSSVWDWLKNLINSIIELLTGILNGILGIFDYLGNLVTDLVKSLVEGISSLLEKLFVPTVALEELFALPSDSGFSQIVDFFNWDKFWNITPKPYEFRTNLNIFDLSNTGNDKEWDIEIKIFENKVVKDNLDLVRNVLSYSLLISVCWFVINHFLPQRDMD